MSALSKKDAPAQNGDGGGVVVHTVSGEAKLETFATEDKRFRKITKEDGTILWLPSVTTKLSFVKVNSGFLDAWKDDQAEKLGVLGRKIELYLAADRGTNVHRAIEKWIEGEDLSKKQGFTDEEWNCICRFMLWQDEAQPKFIKTELPVFSERYQFCGQTDGIIELLYEQDEDEEPKPHRYIVDWKTGKDVHDTHLLQAAAYHLAYEEMTGERLDGVLVLALSARTKCGYKQKILSGTELERFREGFLLHNQLFDWQFPDFNPKTDILPATFTH